MDNLLNNLQNNLSLAELANIAAQIVDDDFMNDIIIGARNEQIANAAHPAIQAQNQVNNEDEVAQG